LEEPKPRYFAGIKWGLDNPTVMLVAQYTSAPKDHLHIMRELYESNLLFDDLLPIAKTWAQELNIRKFFCDPKEPEFIKRMRRQRLWAVPAPEELALARNLLGKRLGNHAKGLPGSLTFSRDCPKTVQEFFKYRMPERDHRRPFRDKPLDMDNYGIGALHFLVLGLATEVTPRVRWI
jgi:hypothetical protein